MPYTSCPEAEQGQMIVTLSSDILASIYSDRHEPSIRVVYTLSLDIDKAYFPALMHKEALIPDLAHESLCIRGWVHILTSISDIPGEESTRS